MKLLPSCEVCGRIACCVGELKHNTPKLYLCKDCAHTQVNEITQESVSVRYLEGANLQCPECGNIQNIENEQTTFKCSCGVLLRVD